MKEQAENYFKILKDAKHKLCPNCKIYKIVMYYQITSTSSLQQLELKSFAMLLLVLKKMLREGDTLPGTFYEPKKRVKTKRQL